MARKEIKYGHPLIVNAMIQKYANQNSGNDNSENNDMIYSLIDAYIKIPQLYEEVEQMCKMEIKFYI